MTRRTRRLVALALVAAGSAGLGGAAGCSDDDEGAVEATTTTSGATTATAGATTSEPSGPTDGSSSTTSTTACRPPAAGEVVAIVDLGGDGVEERWVRVGRGASVEILALEQLEGCEAVPVTVEGGPVELAVGGTVRLLQGVRCEDGRVVHLGATSEDGEAYATLDVVYELRDGELVRVDERTGTLTTADPELAAYSSFDC